ncbi:hypothetical protein WJX81_004056 [Elliptochloris bilobata]|uniref:Uncharacterized protein n=1 Tax=Elliptochloris bilobata TaxID=381761 RepID=A0AAW1SKQ7_9CHLO
MAVQPFLSSTGAKGPLADEEAYLVQLRANAEGEARRELDRTRAALEAKARETISAENGRLCATPFGVDVVGITEVVALTGALVGGISARQRKAELERLNDQLRKINMSLRQQARAGTVYAPGLNYAPQPLPARSPARPPMDGMAAPQAFGAQAAVLVRESVAPPPLAPPAEPSADTEAAESADGAAVPPAIISMISMDEDDASPEARQCTAALREGKRLLKEKQGASALVRFERALMLAKFAGDRTQERRATRGLAAAARLQGQHRTAIQHLQRVLEISSEMGDHVGDADAYGTIADIYTEIGHFERAAEFYDKYIERMSADGPV